MRHKRELCIITIDRARSTLLVTVNTVCTCVYVVVAVGKLSYLLIVLMGQTMVVNIQYISSASISYSNSRLVIYANEETEVIRM